MNKMLIMTLIVYVIVILLVTSMSYNEGYYDGLKYFCQGGQLQYDQDDKVICMATSESLELIGGSDYVIS